MRSAFLIGGFLFFVIGLQFVLVDQFVLNMDKGRSTLVAVAGVFTANNYRSPRVIDPSESVTYTLLSTGIITFLYGWSMPRPRRRVE